GHPEAHPVPLNGLSVALALPFRDETGATRSQLLPASLEQRGDIVTATVKLINDWVRLCYGALAFANFQTQPARLNVAYVYQAYVSVREDRMKVQYGGKVALTPVVYSPTQLREIGDKPFLNATTASYQLPEGEMRFVREAPRSVPGGL